MAEPAKEAPTIAEQLAKAISDGMAASAQDSLDRAKALTPILGPAIEKILMQARPPTSHGSSRDERPMRPVTLSYAKQRMARLHGTVTRQKRQLIELHAAHRRELKRSATLDANCTKLRARVDELEARALAKSRTEPRITFDQPFTVVATGHEIRVFATGLDLRSEEARPADILAERPLQRFAGELHVRSHP